jgi:hypothetical protein
MCSLFLPRMISSFIRLHNTHKKTNDFDDWSSAFAFRFTCVFRFTHPFVAHAHVFQATEQNSLMSRHSGLQVMNRTLLKALFGMIIVCILLNYMYQIKIIVYNYNSTFAPRGLWLSVINNSNSIPVSTEINLGLKGATTKHSLQLDQYENQAGNCAQNQTS